MKTQKWMRYLLGAGNREHTQNKDISMKAVWYAPEAPMG
jgi:hypothetical protein